MAHEGDPGTRSTTGWKPTLPKTKNQNIGFNVDPDYKELLQFQLEPKNPNSTYLERRNVS